MSLSHCNSQNQFLSTKQAAEFLNVTVSFLEQARFRGAGPEYLRLGNKKGCLVRYSKTALDAFLSACVVAPRGSEASHD